MPSPEIKKAKWTRLDDSQYQEECGYPVDPLTAAGPFGEARAELVGAIERSHDPSAEQTFGSNLVRLIEDIAKVSRIWR